jgi:sec-independent protein translocase protein TatA
MFGLGATELGIILVIVVVLFGARRLPEIGSGVGKAIKNFRSGMSGKDEIDVTPEPFSSQPEDSQPEDSQPEDSRPEDSSSRPGAISAGTGQLEQPASQKTAAEPEKPS